MIFTSDLTRFYPDEILTTFKDVEYLEGTIFLFYSDPHTHSLIIMPHQFDSNQTTQSYW